MVILIAATLLPALPTGLVNSWKSVARDIAAPGQRITQQAFQTAIQTAASLGNTTSFVNSTSMPSTASFDGIPLANNDSDVATLRQQLSDEQEARRRLTAAWIGKTPALEIPAAPNEGIVLASHQSEFPWDQSPSRLEPQSSERLVIPELVSAALMGGEHAARWKRGHFLSKGGLHGIEESAWVIKSPQPLVDLGADHGVSPADLVLAGSAIVGKIERVGQWTSTFLPLTHPSFRCRATIVRPEAAGNATRQPMILAQAILAGQGDGTCQLEKIPDTVGLRTGDEVYSADTDGALAHPLFLGTITSATLPTENRHWVAVVTPVFTTPGSTGDDTTDNLQLDLPPRLAVLRLRMNPARATVPSGTGNPPLGPTP
ncbi:MAG: hypothetical protein C0478_06385 [Planctomyces sp.]|nr:hypothetical protein [Planctomyces sp.]